MQFYVALKVDKTTHELEKIVQDHRGNETELNSALRTKHGKDLETCWSSTDAAAAATIAADKSPASSANAAAAALQQGTLKEFCNEKIAEVLLSRC